MAGKSMPDLKSKLTKFFEKYGLIMVLGISIIIMFLFFYVHLESKIGLNTSALILAVLITLSLFVMVLLHIDERIIMSIMLVIIGVIYMNIFPNGSVPDDATHWQRAFEVSTGSLVSEHIGESGVGGNYMSAGLMNYKDESAELDESMEQAYTYGNTALYAPFSYLPQSLGIAIANVFTDNVSDIFSAGRWGNFIVAMVLCIMALYITPFGRKLLFMIMMFPMSMQEMVSLAPDGFVIALSLLYVAYILKLTYQSDVIKKKEIAFLTILSVLISLCKIVYIALLLLIFMIPNSKFDSKKQWICAKFGVIGFAVVLNLIWLSISSGFLIEFNPGVDSGAQVLYVLTNIFEYLLIVIATVIENGAWYVQTLFGSSLGELCVNVSPMAWMLFIILFVYEIGQNRECDVVPHKTDRWIILVTFLGGAALIFTSLYVQWTPYANEMVNGVQGRYFIPFIALLGLFAMLTNREKAIANNINNVVKEKSSYFYFILLLINGIAVLDIINYYMG